MPSIDCQYPECPDAAEFRCVCNGEGVTEERKLCAKHKKDAETICATFGWELSVSPLPVEN